METLKRLQTQIKTKRKAANISQADVARRLGIARNTYGQYETGARTIRVEHLPELAKLFGCTIDDLFTNNAQVWIPVSEPPTEADEYIVMIKGGASATALLYDPTEKIWFEEDARGNVERYVITHWMPMPQAPKEN